MDYIDVFQQYLSEAITMDSAEIQIKEICTKLQVAGNARECAKATICLSFFRRYKQYNMGKIKIGDLLLFIRDFVLYIGRFQFPQQITEAVQKRGDAFGVFVAGDGAVDVIDTLPPYLKDNRHFINEVYRLGEESDTTLSD